MRAWRHMTFILRVVANAAVLVYGESRLAAVMRRLQAWRGVAWLSSKRCARISGRAAISRCCILAPRRRLVAFWQCAKRRQPQHIYRVKKAPSRASSLRRPRWRCLTAPMRGAGEASASPSINPCSIGAAGDDPASALSS